MIIDPGKAVPPAAAPPGTIKDGDTAGFADDVVKASMAVPVVVDFWATWCGPCKTLTPLLERLVKQAGGRVRLVKIDIDKNQELAAQLRIQSVPTVYAFVGGRPVDAFVGAQPESKVRSFIERLTRAGGGSPIDEALELAQESLAAGDDEAAADLFGQILQQDPRHPKALAGLIRLRLSGGDVNGARSLVKGLPADLVTNADIAAAVSAVDLVEQTRGAAGDAADLRRRVQAKPEDHQARYELSVALFAQGLTEGAIDELLAIVRAERGWNDDAARKQLVRIFDALGPTHPLTVASRRRLSSILFS
ncbi:MAG TPA: thioredoxin [Rhodospirillales bacterium]|nr:thioredoxin [Rhodospirillales bacterium]